jgi:hypothetical protein
MNTLLSLVIAAGTPDPLDTAILHMRAAQDAVAAASKACSDAVKTQVKAARMQLELSKEAKDVASARSMVAELSELSKESKGPCPGRVATELDKAIAALNGEPSDPDDDDDLKADTTPPATPPPQPPVPHTGPSPKEGTAPPATEGSTSAQRPTKPFITAGPAPAAQDLDRQVADAAKILAQGFAPLGATLRGYGKRTDWIQALDVGKCYAFVGVGASTTRRLALYLWDPTGKRRADRRAGEPLAVVYHCPFVGGSYHLQAKAKRPEGGYAVGVYVR